MESKPSQQNYFMGILILSVIAFILVLVTPWGGWRYYNYYLGYDEWGSIGLFSWVGFVPLIYFEAVFGFNLYITYLNLYKNQSISDYFLKLGFIGSLGVVIINIVGLIIFWLTNLDSWWWMDAAFYSSLIAGIINGIFYFLLRQM